MDEQYYYLSFRDPDIDRNLGVCIVKADTLLGAINTAHNLKINPGGEVLSYRLTENEFIAQNMILNRLYSREEMIERGHKKVDADFMEEALTNLQERRLKEVEMPEACEYCARTHEEDGELIDLRPFGKDGAWICHTCGTKPENHDESVKNFGRLFLSGEDSKVFIRRKDKVKLN